VREGQSRRIGRQLREGPRADPRSHPATGHRAPTVGCLSKWWTMSVEVELLGKGHARRPRGTAYEPVEGSAVQDAI
jgi:hypothetical protein